MPPPDELLGRHVRQGSHHGALRDQLPRRAPRELDAWPRAVAGAGDAQLGDAEVQHLEPTPPREHDVGGFEVAVDDPVLVGADQGSNDRAQDGDRGAQVRRGWRLAAQALAR